MMERIYWAGYSNEERHSAIHKIQTAISKYGAIVDFHLFSDISMSITIEIEEHKLDNLYKSLLELITLEDSVFLNSTSSKERTLMLSITFTKGTGNLKIEVPAVPG